MSSINLKTPDLTELKPRIMVFGVGGAGCNAVNNMIQAGLQGCDFVVANTDAQSLNMSKSERIVQMGIAVTEGLGAGSQPDVGRAAAEEVIDEIADHLSGSHMVFVTAGMGGGTGTGSAPVVARTAREQGILTVGVVTKPFHFEGQRRLAIAERGIEELSQHVDTLIVIPNQNLFRVANEKTTFADAFAMADQVLYSGVACITDLMVKEGLINLDFADVRSVMRNMGKAMMGTGEASGDGRAMQAAEAAIANPLLDESSMGGARGLLVSVTGGRDLTLFEVDEATTRIREEVDEDANIIFGATFDDTLEGVIRVSVVATGIDRDPAKIEPVPTRDDGRVVALAARAKDKGRAPPSAASARAASVPESAVAAVAADLEAAFGPNAAGDGGWDAGDADADEDDFEDGYEERGESDFADDDGDGRGVEPPASARATGRDLVVAAEPRAGGLRAHQGSRYADDGDRRPMSLLRRIANGLSRRDADDDDERRLDVEVDRPGLTAVEDADFDDDGIDAAAPQRDRREIRAERRAARQAERAATVTAAAAPGARADKRDAAAGQRSQAEAYRRPRNADHEPQSRSRPQPRGADDDQLEIPAFLRRQAN